MARKSAQGNNSSNSELEGRGDGTATIADGDVITASGIDPEDGGSDNRVINPGDILTSSDPGDGDGSPDSGTKKRRGRPRGSTNTKGKRKEVSQDLSGILFTIHFFLSKITKFDDLALDNDECEKLSKAMGQVSRHYTDYVVPEKVIDWLSLFIALGMIYGPRLVAFADHKEKQKAKSGPTVVEGHFAEVKP